MPIDWQLLKQEIEALDAQRANTAYDALFTGLAMPCFSDTAPFRADLTANKNSHLAFFQNNVSMCKAVEDFVAQVHQILSSGASVENLFLIYNASALLHILLNGYEKNNSQEGLIEAIETAHDATLMQFLSRAGAQIDELCVYLHSIRKFLEQLALGNARIFLVELPVGNSILTNLLQHALKPFVHTETIRISLSRNDSKKRGITRLALLKERIDAIALKANDIVIYVDEWSTGANFNRICQHLNKVIPKGVFLLPIGLLTADSESDSKFGSYCEDHDKLLQNWGAERSKFRKVLPPLPSSLRSDGYFFWSEKDRMSGFRKMQLHGSMFSSFDEAIETLHQDNEALMTTAGLFLSERAKDGANLPSDRVKPKWILELFEEAYQDYQQCKSELRRCGDEDARGGEIADFAFELSDLIGKYEKIVQGRKAALAIELGSLYSQKLGSLDPTDRYYFEEHAPQLVELEGAAARNHDVVLKRLISRFDELAKSGNTSD